MLLRLRQQRCPIIYVIVGVSVYRSQIDTVPVRSLLHFFNKAVVVALPQQIHQRYRSDVLLEDVREMSVGFTWATILLVLIGTKPLLEVQIFV